MKRIFESIGIVFLSVFMSIALSYLAVKYFFSFVLSGLRGERCESFGEYIDRYFTPPESE